MRDLLERVLGVDIAAIGISIASLKAIAYGLREITVLTAEGTLVILPVAGSGGIVLGGTELYVGLSMAIGSGGDLLNLISETTQGAGNVVNIKNPVLENIRTGSALKTDAQHAFNDIIDNYAGSAQKFPLVGGDKVTRQLYQIEGSLNGKKGIFEWIVDPDITKGVTHRRFIEGVGITGKPNAFPKK